MRSVIFILLVLVCIQTTLQQNTQTISTSKIKDFQSTISIANKQNTEKYSYVSTVAKVAHNLAKNTTSAPVISNAPTEEPYLKYKSAKPTYSNHTGIYFRRYGIFNCRYAFCSNIKTGKRAFTELRGKKTTLTIIDKCNRKFYFIPNNTFSVIETWTACCAYGMVPATFTTKEEVECFSNGYKNIGGPLSEKNSFFFTSHIDSNLDSRYVSCSNSKSMPKNLWAESEPNNSDGKDAAIILSLTTNAFHDINYDTNPKLVICENLSNENTTSVPKKRSSKYLNKENISVLYNDDQIKDVRENNVGYCMNAFCSEESSGVSKWTSCCKFGMVPVNFETLAEMECVSKKLRAKGIKAALPPVSYIDEKLDRNFTSCLTGEEIPNELWAKGQPGSAPCVILSTDTGKLQTLGCSDPIALLCEAVGPKNYTIIPKAPPKLLGPMAKPSYNATLIRKIQQSGVLNCSSSYCKTDHSKIKDRENGNILSKITSRGNKTYYFNFSMLVNYNENWEKCCEYGLVPLSLDSREEVMFLQKHLKSRKSAGCYTSYIDIDLENNYFSCVSGKAANASFWYPNNPTIYGTCAVFFVDVFSGPAVALKTIACDQKGSLVCQLPINQTISNWYSHVNIKLVPQKKNVISETKSGVPIQENKLQISKTASSESSGINYALIPTNYSKTVGLYNCTSCFCREKISFVPGNKANEMVEISCGGQNYYVLNVNKKLLYGENWQKCCSLGLVPIAIESKETMSCLAKEYFSKPAAQSLGTTFWTGQHDALLNRKFISCKTGKDVPPDLWWPGEPDNNGMREICVAIKFENKNAGLQDLRCGETFNIICEPPAGTVPGTITQLTTSNSPSTTILSTINQKPLVTQAVTTTTVKRVVPTVTKLPLVTTAVPKPVIAFTIKPGIVLTTKSFSFMFTGKPQLKPGK